MRRPFGRGAAVIASLAIVVALTGCGRFGNGADPAAPVTSVSAAPAPPDELDGVLGDLDGVDDALSQVESDTGAGDSASATDDAP